jgi:hypothetical protein
LGCVDAVEVEKNFLLADIIELAERYIPIKANFVKSVVDVDLVLEGID